MGAGRATGRSRALWLAGRRRDVPLPARWVARLVSAYERAPVRDVLTLDLFSVAEGAAAGAAVRAALRLAGVVPDDGPAPPPSRRRGNALAVGLWLLPPAVVGCRPAGQTRFTEAPLSPACEGR